MANRSMFLPSCLPLILGLSVGGLWPGGCRRSYVALSPIAVVVPADKVWSAAQYYASMRHNATVVKGEGTGMSPLYTSGTVLVVEGSDYGLLQEGMTVMYRDANGFRVVHFLVRPTADGWITYGVNEPDYDNARMTKANYLGVVIMAFSPETAGPRR